MLIEHAPEHAQWNITVNETELQIIAEAFRRGIPFNDMPELVGVSLVIAGQLEEAVARLVRESR